ncbi:hypothetical protein GGR56DRAFT_614200 [Xylariaceae sp. FL0804]|nr:hypothetical protein GGR56DRAFT_614200 [Xylariaceae sp. FL0804]
MYNVSLIRSRYELRPHLIGTILAVLEQNLGVLAANILPIASLFSGDVWPASQQLSRATDGQASDKASILSKRSEASKASRRQSNGSSFRIEGPQRASFEGCSAHEQEAGGSWAMGIMKTVSIDIVDEDAAAFERRAESANSFRTDQKQDWERYTH